MSNTRCVRQKRRTIMSATRYVRQKIQKEMSAISSSCVFCRGYFCTCLPQLALFTWFTTATRTPWLYTYAQLYDYTSIDLIWCTRSPYMSGYNRWRCKVDLVYILKSYFKEHLKREEQKSSRSIKYFKGANLLGNVRQESVFCVCISYRAYMLHDWYDRVFLIFVGDILYDHDGETLFGNNI